MAQLLERLWLPRPSHLESITPNQNEGENMKTYNKNTIFKRLLALLADTVIMSVLLALIFAVVTVTGGSMMIFFIAVPLVLLVYPNAFQFSHLAATPGMMMLGLHVSFDDKRIHLSHIKRMLWCIISCLPLGFGFWYCFFNRQGRTVYDIMSASDVVATHKAADKKAIPIATVKINNHKNRTYQISSTRTIIGRNPDICDILFPAEEKGVSRSHCSLTYNEQTNMFLLEDTDSSYGTYLSDGTRLVSGKIYAINPGDTFYLSSKDNKITVEISGVKK